MVRSARRVCLLVTVGLLGLMALGPSAGAQSVGSVSGTVTDAQTGVALGPSAGAQSVGSISGTVTDAQTGGYVQGVAVDAELSSGRSISGACSGPDGQYTLSGLPPGSYRVDFDPVLLRGGDCGVTTRYALQYYKDATSLATATPVQVTAGSTITGIDAAMSLPGSIAGTLYNAHGPLFGYGGVLTVNIYDTSGNLLFSTAVRDDDGTYDAQPLEGFQPGSYLVGFEVPGYAPQFYDRQASLASATPVTVTANSTTTGIDAFLTPLPSQISGTVTDASTHAPIPSASVIVYAPDGSVVGSAVTDSTGAYTVGNLLDYTNTAGSYLVGFAATGHVPQFYNGEPSLASAIASANYVFVAAGSTATGIDAAMEPTTPPPLTVSSPPLGSAIAPLALSDVSQSHQRWRRGRGLPRIARAGDSPVGTTFRFTLNQPAGVRFAFTQTRPGRKLYGRCVAPNSNNRQDRGCTRTVPRAVLLFTGHPGLNRVIFQGRISRTTRLQPGRYTLLVTATSSNGQHSTERLTFTIIA